MRAQPPYHSGMRPFPALSKSVAFHAVCCLAGSRIFHKVRGVNVEIPKVLRPSPIDVGAYDFDWRHVYIFYPAHVPFRSG